MIGDQYDRRTILGCLAILTATALIWAVAVGLVIWIAGEISP